MHKHIFSFCLLAMLVSTGVAHAALFKAGEQYSLPKDSVTPENLYVAAGDAVLSGDVLGDVYAMGGRVLLSGMVSNDASIAGGSVDVLGSVMEDARITGGEITVNTDIGGDLLAVGGSVRVLSDAVTKGDTILAGGEVSFAGTAEKTLRLSGERVVFSGTANGDVKISADYIVIEEGAVIQGSLSYPYHAQITIKEGSVVVGEVIKTQSARDEVRMGVAKGMLALAGLFVVSKVLAMLVTALLAVYLFKDFSKDVADAGVHSFFKSALIGSAAVLLTPLAILLTFVTFFGWIIACIMLALYGILILLGMVYSGILCGAMLAKAFTKRQQTNLSWVFIGVLTLSVASVIPIVGWIIGTVFFMAAVGVLAQMAYRHLWVNR